MRDALIRKLIREALNNGTRVRLTEKTVRNLVNMEISPAATEVEIKEGLNWNHQKGYIRRQQNEDMERYEWAITEKGQAKVEADAADSEPDAEPEDLHTELPY